MLKLSWSSFFRVWSLSKEGADTAELVQFRRILEWFLRYPLLGSRRRTKFLQGEGIGINRKQVQWSMRQTGIAAGSTEKTGTTKPVPRQLLICVQHLNIPSRQVQIMGSMINLSVGRLEIDWGKNEGFGDYSQLFQPSDIAEVPYYYVDEDHPCKKEAEEFKYNLVTEFKEGLSKPLDQVLDRINLLGYTMKYARREFENVSQLNDIDAEQFNFDQLAEALAKVDVDSISADYADSQGIGKFFRRYIFDRLGLERIADDPEYVKFHAGYAMDQLSAYTILQLLALNPSARALPVNWHFADVVSGGWAQRDQFVRLADKQNRFLIVTEGSSDASVIRHALRLLKPHVADFFDFVDMNEGYPFTGTGSLYNFTKGLISISVRNNAVILYDNDAEGLSSFNRTVKLNVPNNMKVLKLPDLPEFRDFCSVGPSGEHRADINGRAAAIECYLDVGPTAVVRWKNFHKELSVYHGELVGKGKIVDRFLAQSNVNDNYDFSKIIAVLNMIVSECTAISELARLASLKEANVSG